MIPFIPVYVRIIICKCLPLYQHFFLKITEFSCSFYGTFCKTSLSQQQQPKGAELSDGSILIHNPHLHWLKISSSKPKVTGSHTGKDNFKKFKATSPVKSALQVALDKNSFLNSRQVKTKMLIQHSYSNSYLNLRTSHLKAPRFFVVLLISTF